jgi:hypothetical protein
MQTVIEYILAWIALSCAFGPPLTWFFFHPERRANAIQAAHDRWIATHPTSPLEFMPPWLRWEDTETADVAVHRQCAGIDVVRS